MTPGFICPNCGYVSGEGRTYAVRELIINTLKGGEWVKAKDLFSLTNDPNTITRVLRAAVRDGVIERREENPISRPPGRKPVYYRLKVVA